MHSYGGHGSLGSFTKAPTIRFSRTAYERMMALVRACKIEVSGFGVLATDEERAEKGVIEPYYIKEIHIADQDCTGATTDLRATALGNLMMDLHRRKIDGKQVAVWWHSHVNMAVGPSQKDVDTLNEFDFDDFAIGVIANKRGDIGIRIEMYKPHRYSFTGCDYSVDDSNLVPKGWAEDKIREHVFVREVRNVRRGNRGSPKRPRAGTTTKPAAEATGDASKTADAKEVDDQATVLNWQNQLGMDRDMPEMDDGETWDSFHELAERGESLDGDMTPEEFLLSVLQEKTFSERIFPSSNGKAKIRGHIHQVLLSALATRYIDEDIDSELATDALYGECDTMKVITHEQEKTA